MDTRIPKPSGLKKPMQISKPLVDFSNFSNLPEKKSEFGIKLFYKASLLFHIRFLVSRTLELSGAGSWRSFILL